ncbi:MAG: hypothetical protein IPK26_22625 [Planctomycetes bacterium]|nr:hypothetical protein [Planctomycetota bacterium]
MIADFARQKITDGDAENLALVLNVLAQCELMRGRTEDARKYFGEAGAIMGNWQTSGGEAFSAIVGSESSKTWKGDPYEKAMNAFYLGLTYLWRGEPDNARAAFKKGILADAEVADEKYQADNALLFWLAGRMSLLMGLRDDAADFFAEADKANAFALDHGARGDRGNPVLVGRDGGNLVVLVECGMGPEKYAAGGQEELARFRPRWHPAARARVWLDGRAVGETSLLCDVDYQARTLGGTEMEGIRKGKAVFKTATTVAGAVLLHQAMKDHGDSARTQAIVGGGLLLLGLLTSTEADVRHWPTLPASVQALTVDAAPGSHRLRIQFLEASGRALPDLDQTWSVTVPERGESYYLFRSLPGLDRFPKANP